MEDLSIQDYCSKCKEQFSRENLIKYCKRKNNIRTIQYYYCRKCNTEKTKKYRKTPTGRENINKANYKANKVHRQKANARSYLNHALKIGKIKKQPCECGKNKTEAHHPDYSKPLEVIWLCRTHHADLHRKIKYEQNIQKH